MILNPPWSRAFFDVLPGSPDEQLQGVYLTLRDLAARGKTNPQDAKATLLALIERKQYPAAIGLNRATSRVKEDYQSKSELKFDFPTDYSAGQATPFEWNITSKRGGIASVEQSGGQQILVLETDGRAHYRPVSRYFALEPGRFRLGYAVRGTSETPQTWARCLL